jgi:hypothetical protein
VRPEVNFLHTSLTPLVFLIEVSMRLVRQLSTGALLIAALGCGSDESNTFGNTTTTGSGGSGATGGAGGAKDGGGGTGAIITTSGGTGGGPGGNGTGGSLSGDAKICGGVEATVETQPFNMLILFDQSSSMTTPLEGDTGPTRWDAVTSALIEFFQSSDAQPLSIGLAYFEQIDPTTFTTSCRDQDYATPEVGIAPMAQAGQVQRLVDSIRSHSPTGLTPTAPALRAALAYAKSYTMTHPGRETMVVLATDGIPTQCTPNQSTEIGQQIAAPAFMGVPSVRTFVVAAASGLTALQYISQAGGTGNPVAVTDAATTSDLIKTAFRRLTRTGLACSYRIPLGGEGGRTDPGMINVDIRPAGAAERRLPLFESADKCGDGWYYDNRARPENIMICPLTCQNLFNGEIRIVVGCAGPPPM